MIAYRVLIVLFVLLNLVWASRRHSHKFNEESHKPIEPGDSEVRYIPASEIGYLNSSSIAKPSNLTTYIYNFGVGYHTVADPPFCCYSASRCNYITPSIYSINISTDRPDTEWEYKLGKYDVAYSQHGPLIDTNIPIFTMESMPTLRIVSALPGTTNVYATWFQQDMCGGTEIRQWRNFSHTWERPMQNPLPTMWYYGPYIDNSGAAGILHTEIDVYWLNVYDEMFPYTEPQRWQVGGMNYIVGGSHTWLWTIQNGVDVKVMLKLYDRTRFHPYHDTSPEIVFPNNGARWYPPWPFTGIYDVQTSLTMYRCYQDMDNAIYPIVGYQEEYNYRTYLVGNVVRTAAGWPRQFPDGAFAPLSASWWTYTSHVEWNSGTDKWDITDVYVGYVPFNDTTPLPTWRNTTLNYPDLLGVVSNPENPDEKCYCAPESKNCFVDPQPPAVHEEFENPWIKPDYDPKPKPHFKPARRV